MDLFDIDKTTRINELSSLILRYQNSYYNGEAEIPDSEFDKLWDELKSLDPKNPILQKVGADSGTFKKARHIMPMGSQEKASCPEEFLDWANKHQYKEYLVEYKLDGASLELQYQHGKLVRAVTRGDGSIGDDITQNAKKMQGVQSTLKGNTSHQPKSESALQSDFTGGIRGEVIMTHAVHQTLFKDKANCRNAANGLMKRKDGKGTENLTLIVYDALCTEGTSPFLDEEEKILWLKKMGFNVVPLKVCISPQDVISYRASVMEERKVLEYDIDGLVVKERAINIEDSRRARPDRQIAFKFSLEEAVTIVRNVEWSESGATYTPVAIFDPVELAGTTVQRASLANPDTLRTLGVQIGSHVVVVKRGEIIPKIENVLHSETEATTPIVFPKFCSTCKTQLVDSGSRLYCPNKSCKKRVLHQIFKWIECADIRDAGNALILSLFNDGILNSISDLYTLTTATLTPYFLNEESLENEKQSLGAKKVYASIQAHRTLSLASFVAGFDIEGLGESMIEKVVSAGFDTIEKLFSATSEQIQNVYGFAEITARALCEGLKENQKEMTSLLKSKTITIQTKQEGALYGKSFCFTGELVSLKRATAENLVKTAGGTIKTSVTKDLSYLVTNDTESGSSKNKKAKELSIPVITENQFLEMLK